MSDASLVAFLQQMVEELRAAHAARLAEKDERISELQREVARLQGECKEHVQQAQAREDAIREAAERCKSDCVKELQTLQEVERERHREETTKLETQLAEVQGRYDRLRQAFQEGIEREGHQREELTRESEKEKDAIRETAERDRSALAKEWKEALESQRERLYALLREQEARHAEERAQLLARPDALAPALADVATSQRRLVALVAVPPALEAVVTAEQKARRQLLAVVQAEVAEVRRLVMEQASEQWDESLRQAHAREAARAEAVFAARRLSVSELRHIHLGKGPAADDDSYAAGEGLYTLFLVLRPGGPVDRFAMRELLKGETEATAIKYNAQGWGIIWNGKHFTIPGADAYELAACVLCHLPALRVLAFSCLPRLSTRGLEWVSLLPQCMSDLWFSYTAYTVADLRELHRRRGSRTYRVNVFTNNCTDWGEFEGVDDDDTKETRVNEELGGMVYWLR